MLGSLSRLLFSSGCFSLGCDLIPLSANFDFLRFAGILFTILLIIISLYHFVLLHDTFYKVVIFLCTITELHFRFGVGPVILLSNLHQSVFLGILLTVFLVVVFFDYDIFLHNAILEIIVSFGTITD